VAYIDHREAACVALAAHIESSLDDAGVPANTVRVLSAWPDGDKWPNKHVVVVSAGQGAEEPHTAVYEGGGVLGIARAEFPMQIDVVCMDRRTLNVLAPAVRNALWSGRADDAGLSLRATEHLNTLVRFLCDGAQSAVPRDGPLLGSWRRSFGGTARCQVRASTSTPVLHNLDIARDGVVVVQQRPNVILTDGATLFLDAYTPLEVTA
jgi:hypothetical protein